MGNVSQEAREKYLKTMTDRQFIEYFFMIVDKRRQEVPFLFNDVQARLFREMADWNIVLKYRKPGVSVMIQSLMLARCLRRRNYNAVVLSFDKESTQRMLERTNWMLTKFPLEVGLERESKNEFKIKEINSKLFIGVAGSRAFGRGEDIDFLHLTEFSWFEDPDIFTGLMEALTPDATVFIESTANGPSNAFARLYRLGKSGKTKWKSHFFPWWIDIELQKDVPADFVHTEEEKLLKVTYNLTNRQLAWRRWKMDGMLEPELFVVEYPSNDQEAFYISGDCIFDKIALANYDKTVSEPAYVGELMNVV